MKKQTITEDFVIINEIAKSVHFWLDEMENKVNEYPLGLDRISAIQEVVKKGLQQGRDFIEKHNYCLNDNKSRWIAKVLFDAGYKQQCMVLDPFEAETQEDAQKVADAKVGSFFEDVPNVEILEIKVSKVLDLPLDFRYKASKI